MHTFRFSVVLLLLCFTLQATVWAQEQKVPVQVTHDGGDIIGQRLAFSLREAIRSSSGYRLVDDSTAIFSISLVTIDPEASERSAGVWTAASVVFLMTNFIPFKAGNPQTWYPIYLTSSVVTAGSQRVDEQAKGILASLDNSIEVYKKSMKLK